MEDLRKRLRFMPEKASFCTGEMIRNASSTLRDNFRPL